MEVAGNLAGVVALRGNDSGRGYGRSSAVAGDHHNCGVGSDEEACSAAFSSQTVSLESTSGRHITLETLSVSSGVFHDCMFAFQSLGYFAGIECSHTEH